MYPDKILGIFTLYGLMIGIGIAMCFVVLYVYGKKAKIDNKFLDFIFYNGIASIVVGFFFAFLFQAVLDYIKNPEGGFHFKNLTVMGGLMGGAACFLIIYFIFRKRFKQGSLLEFLPIAPCCILIAHAFGRIGCFFAGCCYGIETNSWLGVQFPGRAHKVLPTQLYESAFLFLMFALCSVLFYKRDYKYNMPLYLVCYGVWRFLIEFLRDDNRGAKILGLQPSQFWSIFFVLGGIACFFWFKKLYAKNPKPESASIEDGSQQNQDKQLLPADEKSEPALDADSSKAVAPKDGKKIAAKKKDK